MESIFERVSEWGLQNPEWLTLTIGAAILIEGKLTMFFGTFLARAGAISWLKFLGTAFLTLVTAETAAYLVSRNLRYTRLGWKLYRRLKSKKYAQFLIFYLKRNLTAFFFIQKFFLSGTGLVVFFTLGWSRISFGKFLKSYLTVTVTWFFAMIFISYLVTSGFYHAGALDKVEGFLTFVAAAVLLMIVAPYLARKFFKKKLVPDNQINAPDDGETE